MNSKRLKLIFSKRLNALVVIGEHCTRQGNSIGDTKVVGALASPFVRFVGALCFGFSLVSTAFAAPLAGALPQGGVVAQGAATISQSANVMNVTQSSDKAVVNWQSFDVGAAAKFNVLQPSSSSVLLNRVVGNNPSQIFGAINANGQVVLVNPNGIVFGSDGSVNASAFTASTLGISDADFMSANYRFTRDGATGSILNQGTLNAGEGGYIALLGVSVTNEGKIVTQGGNVYMGAAEAVTLPVSKSGRIKMALEASMINAVVNNAQDGSVVTNGGHVFMQAAAVNDVIAQASINHAGSIDTSAAQAGSVQMLTDDGVVTVRGSVKANSNNLNNKGGDIVIGRDVQSGVLANSTDVSGAKFTTNKGFVETSGHVLVVDGSQVEAKDWLLDPNNIDITGDATSSTSGYSKIKASDIANTLNLGTSVTITTTGLGAGQPAYSNAAGTGAGAAVAGDGNILINAAIVKSGASDASLTLLADNGINVSQRVGRASADTTSAGKLNVTMTANGNAANSANSLGITLNSVIDANGGTVILNGTSQKSTAGGAGIVFTNSGITASSFSVSGNRTTSPNDASGIYLSGTNTFKSTSISTPSTFVGNSASAGGNFRAGVYIEDNSTTNFDSGAGAMSVVGTNPNGGYSGIRIGSVQANPQVNTKGNVTLGANILGAYWFQRGGTITNLSGTLTIAGSGIEFYDSAVANKAANGTTVNISSPSVAFGSVGNISLTPVNAGEGYSLNINTDKLSASSGSALNAGTGTVILSNLTAATFVNVGSVDATGTPATLGISNAELNTIAAAKTIIGSSTAGNLSVSAAITTLAATGNIELRSGVNIAINNTFTIGGATGTKNLTLNATGSASTVTQTAAIKATGLELLGTNATQTLSNTSNSVQSITANTRQVAYTNVGAFTVNDVSTLTGDSITSQQGDLTIAGNVSNSTSGDVILGAGVANIAGTSTGGDIKTTSGKTASNANASGKVYLYSGGVANTDLLSNLNSSLANFYLSTIGSNTKNTLSKTAFGSTITNGPQYQVMFREAIDLGAVNLAVATVNKTYGEVNSSYVGAGALTADVSAALKVANSISGTSNTLSKTLLSGAASSIQISASDLVDALSVSSTTAFAGTNYSTTNNLKANATGYGFSLASNGLYTVGMGASSAKVVVAQKSITINGITAANKTYDATTGTIVSIANAAGWIAGDAVTVSNATGSFDTKNVGTGKTVTLANSSYGGTDVGNYSITDQASTTADINKANLTITANADARFVTQIDATGYNGVSYSGFVNGETSTVLGGTLNISRTNASSNVSAASYAGTLVASGLTSGNYNIHYSAGDYTIVPANQLLIRTTNVSTVYGTAPTFSVTAQYLDSGTNLINSLSQSGTGNNLTFNDGAGCLVGMLLKPYTVSSGVTTAAGASTSGNTVVGNYSILDTAPVITGRNFLGSPVYVGTLTVTPKALAAVITVRNKVYDGGVNASVTGSSPNIVTGDLVSFANISATFGNKNAGTGLVVSISGITIGDLDAGNYTLQNITANSIANISPEILQIVGSVALDKAYDGITTAVVIPGTLQGLLSGETLNVTATGEFFDPLVGSHKQVSAFYTLLDGSNGGLAGNYQLTASSLSPNNISSGLNDFILFASITGVPKTVGSVGLINPVSPMPSAYSNKLAWSTRIKVGVGGRASTKIGGQCSEDSPEKCVCEDTAITSVTLCRFSVVLSVVEYGK